LSSEENTISGANAHESKVPRFNLEKDVILPRHTRQMMDEAIGSLRFHKLIYSDWGFSEVDPSGRNMAINFYGPPGTGKTLAAEALAGTLGLKFIHIGISEIESKFVGETAKNISAAFQEATLKGALLFFDEADTLLGARLSSVTQGIDNEINAMRSTMLIELERFNGVVVFATNFAQNYDSAFVSRIRYHVEFQLPDLEERQRLWERMLVKGIPLALDRADLIHIASQSSAGLSGREIRTALRTALPRAVMEKPDEPKLAWIHIESAIEDIRYAKNNVGGGNKQLNSSSARSIKAAQTLLGIEK
jgi:AAA+ superfamily predicted ATPase